MAGSVLRPERGRVGSGKEDESGVAALEALPLVRVVEMEGGRSAREREGGGSWSERESLS